MLKSVSSSKTLMILQCYSPNTIWCPHRNKPIWCSPHCDEMLWHLYANVVRTGNFPTMAEEPVSTMQHTYTFRRSPAKEVGPPKLSPPPPSPVQEKTLVGVQKYEQLGSTRSAPSTEGSLGLESVTHSCPKCHTFNDWLHLLVEIIFCHFEF